MEGDSEEMTYLKQDQISEVISEGLAKVFERSPKYPIDFLAKWLLNYCDN